MYQGITAYAQGLPSLTLLPKGIPAATFYGALNQLFCGLKQMYPNTEIIIMTPLKRRNFLKKNQFGNTLPEYVAAIQQMSTFYGIRVIDLFHAGELDFSGKQADLLVDGLHPNAKGHALLADYIADKLYAFVEEL